MARPRLKDSPEGRVRLEEKYRRILDGALSVFADKGFYEAKINEIAKVAGVADGTIYLYFANKDDLLISLFETKLEEINRGLEDRLAAVDDPLGQLEAIVRYHLGMAGAHPDLAAFITIELRRSAKFMKEHAKKQFAEYIAHIEHAVDAGRERGIFRKEISARTFKHLVFGALDQAVLTWLANPHRQAHDLEDIGTKLMDFLKRGMAAETPG